MRKEQRKDRNIKSKSHNITDMDSAGHQIGEKADLLSKNGRMQKLQKKRPQRKDVQINETSTLR